MKSRQQQQQQQQQPTEQEIQSKLNEYIIFIDKTLQPQLQIAISNREEIEDEIQEYHQLQKNLQMVKLNKINNETMVDLGHEIIYCQAKIINREKVFVSIGMGFHAEFTIDEALLFVQKRMNFLKMEKLPSRVDKAREIAGHLESSMELLESLSQEMRDVGLDSS